MKYLALGDSYTIGEQVEEKDNFPNQLSELLKKNGFPNLEEPRIIAKTGWTSGELLTELESAKDLDKDFSFVTLLIGVNDQYRGLSIEEYKKNFLKLLLQSILQAKGDSRHVFVLSIPDWGATPFAEKEGKDRERIAAEIKEFNKQNQIFSMAYRCHYLNITPLSRKQGSQTDKLAEDQLHYNAEAYKEWAVKMLHFMEDNLKQQTIG